MLYKYILWFRDFMPLFIQSKLQKLTMRRCWTLLRRIPARPGCAYSFDGGTAPAVFIFRLRAVKSM